MANININELYRTKIYHIKGVKKRFMESDLAPLNKRQTGHFVISLYPEDAQRLSEMGWAINKWSPDDDPMHDEYTMRIAINYWDSRGDLKVGNWAPIVWKCIGGNSIMLEPSQVITLAKDNIVDASISINPNEYNGNITAYLRQATFVVDNSVSPASNPNVEDDFADMYGDRL